MDQWLPKSSWSSNSFPLVPKHLQTRHMFKNKDTSLNPMPPSDPETTFLPFGAQIIQRLLHTPRLIFLIFRFPSSHCSLAVTSPMSQNSFSLHSPPPVLFPNLRMTSFCILVSMVTEVCLARQPWPCTYRIPPPLSLLLCSSSRLPSFLFPRSSLSYRSVCWGLSPCSFPLSPALSQDLITIHNGAETRNSTRVSHSRLPHGHLPLGWSANTAIQLSTAGLELAVLPQKLVLAGLASRYFPWREAVYHFLKVTLLGSSSSSSQCPPPAPFSLVTLCCLPLWHLLSL